DHHDGPRGPAALLRSVGFGDREVGVGQQREGEPLLAAIRLMSLDRVVVHAKDPRVRPVELILVILQGPELLVSTRGIVDDVEDEDNAPARQLLERVDVAIAPLQREVGRGLADHGNAAFRASSATTEHFSFPAGRPPRNETTSVFFRVRASSTLFPISSSVRAELDAIAAAQPNVLTRASAIFPSRTTRVSFTWSPHVGLRTKALWVGWAISPVFLGLRKWSMTVALYSSNGICQPLARELFR